MFLALAYKEDSTGSEGLKDVGKVFLQYWNNLAKN